ncbi:hypothetical protein UA08_04038 [Talaromyces atroroseus]|uniref:Uncharacterized protein n=1 Tax=Talaromyces atroroseus TaxID=1441469 RepID=A0A1Q5Q8F9_TALAT|nr:hypothetical protein UA08_04038 [Talaromyces atroroseus]OKL60394.1 hypothetical protein UA08_04038 [Talaromyces atroroseus]
MSSHSGSRRWAYQQHPQQDLPSSRPVHAAHLNLDRAYSFEREPTRRSNTALKNGTRPRSSPRLPRTLKDAFDATSRTAAMDPNEHTAMPDRTPSPSSRRRQRNLTLPFPLAAVTSPPPGELLETYQRINDADDLADLVSEDDLDIDPPEMLSRRSSKERKRRRESPGSLNLRYTQGEERDDNLGPVFSYLDDVTDDHARGKLSTYKRDEERLNRVTASQSPVFSKAKVGSMADSLQRRDSDPPTTEEARDFLGEDGLRLGLNVPKNWGNKAKNHRQWLSSFSRPEAETLRGETPGALTERARKTRVESRSRSPRPSNASPSRKSDEFREGREQISERSRLGAPPSDGLHNHSRARSRSLGRAGLTGDAIPNTPVTIYKSTSRDRTQKTRSDSRDLLRKLARTESPNQHSTPEQKKPIETPLPEKTPVVIGAWIDTPMTVRNPDTNGEDETKEIDSPSKSAPKSTVIPILRPSGSGEESERKSTDVARSGAHAGKASAKSNIPPEKALNDDSMEKKPPQPGLIKPKIPKSALEGILEDAKSNADPLNLDLGDDTINSLQGIINNADSGSSRFMKMKEESLGRELDAIESDLDQQPIDDKPQQSLDHMGSKLQSIIYSIRDARTGLNDLHEALTSDNSNEAIHIKRCETCGTPQRDGRIYVAIPIPRLWRRDHVSRHLRLTYLGWLVVIFACWYISESTMCDYYCHPAIAEVCDGYCLQPDAPQFPFTLPTMLWRWSHLSSVFSPIITIFIAFFRLIAQILGVWDGYVDDNYLSDFRSSPSSASSFNHVPVDNPQLESRNGLFGLWPAGFEKASTFTSTTAAAATSTSIPTILQKVITDPRDAVVDDSMDGDEIL